MATDPITIDVIANALKSLIYEMDAAIERTAMSIIIREQHDFGMSLVDHRGWVVAGTPFAGQTLLAYAATHPLEPEAARETLAREVEGRAEKDQRRLIQLLGDAGRSADVLLEKEPEIG